MSDEEKIGRLLKVFLEYMEEMFEIQNRMNIKGTQREWDQIIKMMGNIMRIDDILQTACDLGISGSNMRDESAEVFISLKNELSETSKKLRESLTAKESYPQALYFISQFQLLQRKIIKNVANALSPKPLYQFSKKEEMKVFSKNVFIVHGKDEINKLRLFNMLIKLGFNPIILAEQADIGRTIIEKLEEETIDVGFAFILLTPDDLGISINSTYEEAARRSDNNNAFVVAKKLIERGGGSADKFVEYCERFIHDPDEVMDFLSILNARARQNVILELGYFIGKIGRNRVCCLHKGDLKLPSDIHGVIYKPFKESVEECYNGIVKELKEIGYEIDG